eukprot:CAMPEP_0197882268 /NCGR_PEP_ID=MMETSP1439-20131203/9479_1 /TAXON_ID=66791 /ORGANISM="Gonyaulax spinifera, Strain CCMP409" /LENGTH=45 /DNA_ID= /DNA_START= /DNA_END= /DNA_ORIENTATION=
MAPFSRSSSCTGLTVSTRGESTWCTANSSSSALELDTGNIGDAGT